MVDDGTAMKLQPSNITKNSLKIFHNENKYSFQESQICDRKMFK
jgi:hypothetical protein